MDIEDEFENTKFFLLPKKEQNELKEEEKGTFDPCYVRIIIAGGFYEMHLIKTTVFVFV